MANILVVDDEHGIRDLLWEILNDEGHNVEGEGVAEYASSSLESWSASDSSNASQMSISLPVRRWRTVANSAAASR